MPLKAVPGTASVEGGLELEVATGEIEQPERRRAHDNDTTALKLRTGGLPSMSGGSKSQSPIVRMRDKAGENEQRRRK
jgi:hypothetical protein